MTDTEEKVARAILVRIESGWPEIEAPDPVDDDWGSKPLVCGSVGEDKYVLIDGGIKPLDIAQAAISAYESALKEQGLVIVPRWPTEEMLSTWPSHRFRENDGAIFADDAEYNWRIMIDAALKPNDT